MGIDSAFGDLRRLADWFAVPSGGRTQSPLRATQIERLVHRLGGICVPLLGRELCHADPRRRDSARAALAHLATTPARPRVIAELHQIAASAAADEGKVCALGLLAELGERGAARFSDPSAIQRRSALALAAQLDTPADVAAAADLMIRQLAPDDMLQLLTVMSGSAAPAAQRLAAELCVRVDLASALRERINETVFGADADGAESARPPRAPRPTHVAILVDAAARLVVVASRKISGERRYRRFAVLVDREGRIDDCVHEDASDDHAPLIAKLVADGYRVASSDLERARGIVAAAARQTAEEPTRLASSYYLGRDLLDLGDAHLGGRVHAHPTSTTLGRAIELIADGAPARAQLLLARCKQDSADVAAAQAACLLANNQLADALAPLQRAADLEPAFALHHWNLAATLHQLGDRDACLASLRRFLSTAQTPSGLAGDPDHPARVGLALRMISELERTARLARAPRRRRRRRTAVARRSD